ncbi:MAG: adenosylcobinamide-GDP ribazoletransferase [Geminicoccaceae bacterium]|nr:adenosylcobinamide-GDP ribazoletransferase [Geminicoccaceae bacterium]
MPRRFLIAALFLTRLPVRVGGTVRLGDLAAAAPFFPVVGLGVGAVGGSVLALGLAVGLPFMAPALLALLTTAALTGALHEDGLADTADALGVVDRHKALAVMRDSRIGAYGALALLLATLLKATALAGLPGTLAPALAFAAAHALGRGVVPPVMRLQPSARSEGLAAAAGAPSRTGALLALGLGTVPALVLLPAPAALTALAAALASGAVLAFLLGRRFSGCTGDTLGAVEQAAETVLLLGLAAALG